MPGRGGDSKIKKEATPRDAHAEEDRDSVCKCYLMQTKCKSYYYYQPVEDFICQACLNRPLVAIDIRVRPSLQEPQQQQPPPRTTTMPVSSDSWSGPVVRPILKCASAITRAASVFASKRLMRREKHRGDQANRRINERDMRRPNSKSSQSTVSSVVSSQVTKWLSSANYPGDNMHCYPDARRVDPTESDFSWEDTSEPETERGGLTREADAADKAISEAHREDADRVSGSDSFNDCSDSRRSSSGSSRRSSMAAPMRSRQPRRRRVSERAAMASNRSRQATRHLRVRRRRPRKPQPPPTPPSLPASSSCSSPRDRSRSNSSASNATGVAGKDRGIQADIRGGGVNLKSPTNALKTQESEDVEKILRVLRQSARNHGGKESEAFAPPRASTANSESTMDQRVPRNMVEKAIMDFFSVHRGDSALRVVATQTGGEWAADGAAMFGGPDSQPAPQIAGALLLKDAIVIGECSVFDQSVSRQFILPMHDTVLDAFLKDTSTLRASCVRTRCRLELNPRILNRRVLHGSWVKYLVVTITGPTMNAIENCDRFLKKNLQAYRMRRAHDRETTCCLYLKEDTPDNANLCFSHQRTGVATTRFGNLKLESPFRGDQDSGWKRGPTKYGQAALSGKQSSNCVKFIYSNSLQKKTGCVPNFYTGVSGIAVRQAMHDAAIDERHAVIENRKKTMLPLAKV